MASFQWEALLEQLVTNALLSIVRKVRGMRDDELDELEAEIARRKQEIDEEIGPLIG